MARTNGRPTRAKWSEHNQQVDPPPRGGWGLAGCLILLGLLVVGVYWLGTVSFGATLSRDREYATPGTWRAERGQAVVIASEVQTSSGEDLESFLGDLQVSGGTGDDAYSWAEAGDVTLIPVSKIPNLSTAKITSGLFDPARIPNLHANKITTGTFVDARIPVLNANKITSGTLADARIPASIARDSELIADTNDFVDTLSTTVSGTTLTTTLGRTGRLADLTATAELPAGGGGGGGLTVTMANSLYGKLMDDNVWTRHNLFQVASGRAAVMSQGRLATGGAPVFVVAQRTPNNMAQAVNTFQLKAGVFDGSGNAWAVFAANLGLSSTFFTPGFLMGSAQGGPRDVGFYRHGSGALTFHARSAIRMGGPITFERTSDLTATRATLGIVQPTYASLSDRPILVDPGNSVAPAASTLPTLTWRSMPQQLLKTVKHFSTARSVTWSSLPGNYSFGGGRTFAGTHNNAGDLPQTQSVGAVYYLRQGNYWVYWDGSHYQPYHPNAYLGAFAYTEAANAAVTGTNQLAAFVLSPSTEIFPHRVSAFVAATPDAYHYEDVLVGPALLARMAALEARVAALEAASAR